MAKVMLTKGFKSLKVGKEQLLQISEAVYDTKFKKIKLTFEDETGGKLTEPYDISKEGAMGAFSTVAKCALHITEEVEIDPTDLKGLFIVADVVEQEGMKDGEPTGRFFLHLRNIQEYEEEDWE